MAERKTENVGGLRKNCPSCGAPIESFQTRCPSCGHELNAAEISKCLKEFIEGLEECMLYDLDLSDDFERNQITGNKIEVNRCYRKTGDNVYSAYFKDSLMRKEGLDLFSRKFTTDLSDKFIFEVSDRDYYSGEFVVNVNEGQSIDKNGRVNGEKAAFQIKSAHRVLSLDFTATRYQVTGNNYHWNMSDTLQRSFVLNYVLPNTKEDILELLIYITGKIVPERNSPNPSLYEREWNNIWIRKARQIVAKARLCLKVDPAVLKTMEELLLERGIKPLAPNRDLENFASK